MLRQTLYLWKQAPFLRLVIPFMAGILLQWYGQWPVLPAWIFFFSSLAGLVLFNLSGSFSQYRAGWMNGIFINTLMLCAGLLTAFYKDSTHQPNWLNHCYHDQDLLTVILEEPLAEKENTYKTTASVQQLLHANTLHAVSGKLILYIKKDSLSAQLHYGSQLAFRKSLQPIKNSGNPGSFDYQRYAGFQGIFHQVFLQAADYSVLAGEKGNGLKHFLYASREQVLRIITHYIPGEKEAGLAEALLTGYKDDLDRTLVQSYSNTGVVHIIAISGMHLGLIYWLLDLVLTPFKKRKQTRWAVPAVVVAGLWLFSLMAGGGPSILRSAVMFTCIVLAESVERKTFIYNSLAASAFLLLCINPFWLWDIGFQLSYTALLSIIIFTKPVYHWFNFTNTIIDATWKLMAVTLAAQVLTTPVSIYHFHQFPVYFLLTNLLAVPLSSLIVLLEIALCAIAWLPGLAKPAGMLLHWLIQLMNRFIEHMENLPFALWNNLQINIMQLVLLYVLISATACWLIKKNKTALLIGLFCLFGFVSARTYSFISAGRRRQLIVYNIPRHQAMDFINGRNCFFQGDTGLMNDRLQQNFTFNPARTLYRVKVQPTVAGLFRVSPVFVFNNKKIVLVDAHYRLNSITEKINADLIVLSGNPSIYLHQLMAVFSCKQVVFDASDAPWKVNKWKAEAAKLGLNCFYTVDNGAFVMNMD